MMKLNRAALITVLILTGCGKRGAADSAPNAAGSASPTGQPFAEQRRTFKTKLVRQEKANEPVDHPPTGMFQIVQFDSPLGKLPAYLSPNPGDGKKHPALIWIFGGFSNGIGDTAWEKAERKNDQSAGAYRQAGLITMYPSRRGGNQNPGFKECCFGEVDDVLAAADYLAQQDYVDPHRIYLGGHSTGGTLVLLAAELSTRFRAVFSFGPVESVGGYGADNLPFDTTDKQELYLRAPILWLPEIRGPVFVFEGSGGNADSLNNLAKASRNPLAHFHLVKGVDHFSILAPINQLIAQKILQDTGAKCTMGFSESELKGAVGK